MSFATRAAAALPKDDPHEVYSRRIFSLVTTIIVLVLAVASYIARLAARKKSYQPLKWDDYLMGMGLLIFLEPTICQFMLFSNGLGHHIWNISAEQKYNFSRLSFALQRANQPALVCIKLSILIFYMRLFPSQTFHRWAYANGAYTLCWGIATYFVNLTVCTPIAYYYDKTIVGGHCKNQAISGVISGAMSLFGDICILALPVPMVWNLRINLRRKVALICIFMLGAFVCVTSAIRIVYIWRFVPTDASYTQVFASTWTTLEMGVAVISGNLPLMRPLFEFYFRTGNTTNDSNSHSKSHNTFTGISTQGNSSRGALRSKVDENGFERISDDGIESEASGSRRDIELRGMEGMNHIIIKTDVSVVQEARVRNPSQELVERVDEWAVKR